MRVSDLDLGAFICATSIEAVAHNAVLHRCAMLPETDSGAPVDGAARLVAGYLKGA